MILFDATLRYLTLFDTTWNHLMLFDAIWIYLTLLDAIWRYLTLLEIIWRYLLKSTLSYLTHTWVLTLFDATLRYLTLLTLYDAIDTFKSYLSPRKMFFDRWQNSGYLLSTFIVPYTKSHRDETSGLRSKYKSRWWLSWNDIAHAPTNCQTSLGFA